jgi:hypothetical protein
MTNGLVRRRFLVGAVLSVVVAWSAPSWAGVERTLRTQGSVPSITKPVHKVAGLPADHKAAHKTTTAKHAAAKPFKRSTLKTVHTAQANHVASPYMVKHGTRAHAKPLASVKHNASHAKTANLRPTLEKP